MYSSLEELTEDKIFSYCYSQFVHPFSRYADFTDLAKLNESSSKPLRKSMRVNTLKCSTEEFKNWAKSRGWMIEQVPWCREGFYVDREDRSVALGKDLLHVLGYVYMQESASMLPVSLLDPQPGDKVLDMSAAPGSKTTQIGARVKCGSAEVQSATSENKSGFVIANDVQEKRIWSLLSNLQRCGVVDSIVTRKVGQWFANAMTEQFDRVLCDAPCTAQGTIRKDSDALTYCSLENTEKMARLQVSLLESAIHACKVGGRIVYSTCTLTPEENEGVVLSILQKFPTHLRVVDPSEDVRHQTWDVRTAIQDSIKVQASLQKNFQLSTFNFPLLRLWPQTYDTEGFFSAVLEKTAPTKDSGQKEQEFHRFDLLPKSRVREVKENLIDWYGTSFIRDDEVLLETKEQLLILPESALHFPLPLKPYYSGMPFGKLTDHGLVRLSHEMATLRGHEATKQILHLPESEMKKTLAGVSVTTSVEGFDDGDVLLGLEDNALSRPMIFGRGLLKKGAILNRLPREIVRMFT